MAKKKTDYTEYSMPSEEIKTEAPAEVKEEPKKEVKKADQKGIVVGCVKLNVRERPNAQASIVEIIAQGSTVTIISSEVGWYKVKTAANKTGYAMAQYIKIL